MPIIAASTIRQPCLNSDSAPIFMCPLKPLPQTTTLYGSAGDHRGKRPLHRHTGIYRVRSGREDVAHRSAQESFLRNQNTEHVPNDQSRAVGRILAVLEELSIAASPLANHELASRLGVPVASMYRLLKKLCALGYVEKSGSEATYGVGPRLAELGERLADAGGRAPPLRRMMRALHTETGHYITVWVPSGVHVRIAALLVGRIRGPSPGILGELGPPFSTPGLAIASQLPRDEVRALIAHCKRKRISLGRRFADLKDVDKALRTVRSRGFASGYNLRADGWGILAFPITITRDPLRIGALVIGAHAAILRRDEEELVLIARKTIDRYMREQRGRTELERR
jgi:IclR family transcriptional regulator, acetate operon repressor